MLGKKQSMLATKALADRGTGAVCIRDWVVSCDGQATRVLHLVFTRMLRAESYRRRVPLVVQFVYLFATTAAAVTSTATTATIITITTTTAAAATTTASTTATTIIIITTAAAAATTTKRY